MTTVLYKDVIRDGNERVHVTRPFAAPPSAADTLWMQVTIPATGLGTTAGMVNLQGDGWGVALRVTR